MTDLDRCNREQESMAEQHDAPATFALHHGDALAVLLRQDARGECAAKQKRCECGYPHDGWPGKDGAMLCQMCWEAQCSSMWWAALAKADGTEGTNG